MIVRPWSSRVFQNCRSGFNAMSLINLHRLTFSIGLLSVALLLSACASESDSKVVQSDVESLESASPSPETTAAPQREACQDGAMLVGDLVEIDAAWPDAINIPIQRAASWHDDAQLVYFRVSCALFEPGFRLQLTFYSGQAQALLATDTGESVPVNLDPNSVQSLDVESLSFAMIRQSLLDADFTDDLELDPSTGVDIRINSEESPFGPDSAPLGSTLAHVSIHQSGRLVDLFIDTKTGDIYRYTLPA
jgi:hypothetical protein